MSTFCTIASGSSGNCAIYSDGSTHILVDAGISMRRIKTALREFGLGPEQLSGIIITHDHSDHIYGLEMMTKYYKLPLHASIGTGRRLLAKTPSLRHALTCFQAGEGFEIGGTYIGSFKTPHDAGDSVGYTLSCSKGRKIGFATDLGYMTDEILAAVAGAELLVLEANHDVEMLRCGSYPYYLKERILGEYGHLSNKACGKAAAALCGTGVQRIVLAHLSRENNTPALARETVETALSEDGVKAGRDILLDVAPRLEPGAIYEL